MKNLLRGKIKRLGDLATKHFRHFRHSRHIRHSRLINYYSGSAANSITAPTGVADSNYCFGVTAKTNVVTLPGARVAFRILFVIFSSGRPARSSFSEVLQGAAEVASIPTRLSSSFLAITFSLITTTMSFFSGSLL